MQYIYTCATNFLHVNQRWLAFLVGSSVGCPLNCPLYPYLKVVGCPLSCTLSCPLYPYMEVVGSLICIAKFPWAAHGQPIPLPTELPSFFTFGSSWLPIELPTVSIYGSSGQPNLHCKIPMGSPLPCPLSCPLFPYMEVVGSLLSCPLSCPLFPYMEVVGSLLSCSLSCPLFPYMEVVGSLIYMAKFPWAAPSIAHVQPMGSELGSSPVFSVWELSLICSIHVFNTKVTYLLIRYANGTRGNAARLKKTHNILAPDLL